MKKFAIWSALILAVLIIGMFFIRQQVIDTDITAKQTRVGFILIGSRTDHSWSQSHYEGMEKTAKELNLSVYYHENTPENEECREVIERMIAEGCKIIIVNSFGFGPYALEAAQKHPDIWFFYATGVDTAENLSTYFGRIYQMRYLSGIAAGLQTKTGQIGYAAAFDMSEVNRGINAFTLGVRSVNPTAQVNVSFIGSWMDDDLTEAAVEKLFDAEPQIDVLAMHTNSLRAMDLAKEKGIWTVGYNIDNSELYPDHFLTAPVWNWEAFYTPYILECLQGKFSSQNYWLGAETGVVGLAPLTEHVSSETAAAVEAAYEKLRDGSFDVFYGPITDNQGKVRIEEGESMPDDAMLNEFDWFVEGVRIYE